MLVYHFLPANHALDDITQRRMKIATLDDLNDPFELWAFSHPDRKVRRKLRESRDEIGRTKGMLCFSEDWHSPLLWSHYADKHRGMVLGFDVNDNCLLRVRYVKARPIFTHIDYQTAQALLLTKFKDWQYEKELRVFTNLQERDPVKRIYFTEFSDSLKLRKVISGPLCETPKAVIQDALRSHKSLIALKKARLAFRSFRVVTNKLGFNGT